MNEVDPTNATDFGASPPMALTMGTLSLLHVLCCGVPLLLVSGSSLATVLSSWELLVLGVVVIAAILLLRRVRARRSRGARPVQDDCCATKANGRS